MESPQCHLIYFSGSRAGEAEPFGSARISIGRAANSDFRVESAYEDVAQHHAEILFEDGTFVIYDLGAKSGTYVNGQRVKERRPLQSEDYLKFGADGLEVIFRTGTPLPGYQPIPALTADDAQIQFISGSDAGRNFVVSGSSVTRIGRRQELEIALDPRGDMIVSGNHCSISFQDGAWILTDTSRNGTYVNNELVDGSLELRDGDVIMLGDGGPQGRFRSRSAGVHYPNLHRMETAAAAFAHDEQSRQRNEPADFYAQETPSPEVSPAPVAATIPPATTAAATGVSQVHFPPESATDASAPGSLPSRNRVQASRTRPRLKKWLAAAAILTVVVIATVLIATIRPDAENRTSAAPRVEPVNYAKAVQSTKELANDAGFYKVAIPETWRTKQQGALLSLESPDRELAVDYVRHVGLSEDRAREILGAGNAPVAKVGNSAKGTTDQQAFVSRSGGTARIGVLHKPPQGVPMLAMLETSEKLLPKIEGETIQKLLIENIDIEKVPGYEPQNLPQQQASAPATTPTAAPRATLKPVISPTPGKVVASAPPTAPAPTASPSPAMAASPVVTPNVTPPPATTPNVTPVPTQNTTPATEGQTVQSEAIGATLNLPEGWHGTSDEEEGIVEITAEDSMSVRLARDPDTMQMETVLEAMAAEGWEQAGVKSKNTFSAAELSRGDERLLLVLVPTKTGGTNIIYATRTGNFTPEQRDGIVQLVQQLR